ncbi:Translin [Punctularia strigosozonata HHB-11173 SS5]|uniref:Translin n=1 Tax=Punctularia strigosozonata (strain HHB-11173) TaxID=741275 RepID=UPI0004417C9F|nr:Translin [Punctularia strigosozonata HHB-11173 SS5]EIN13622.1 Translin [Punctularia strigosozonata HHB-11173 SS5]
MSSRDGVLADFAALRDELDDHNDRRERIIKASRDITNASKRTIFLLHRLVTEDVAEGASPTKRAADGAKDKLADIQRLFAGLREDLQNERFWRYKQNISGGLQEYIEALSLAHYFEHGNLIPYETVQKTLTGEDGIMYLPLPVDDYLLGISDLTGELMRYAVSAISRKSGRAKASEVCGFVRNIKADFEGFTPHIRELRKKQRVTASSLQKIEDAAYAITVRTAEYDLPQEMLDEIVSQCISDVGGSAAQAAGLYADRRRLLTRASLDVHSALISDPPSIVHSAN